MLMFIDNFEAQKAFKFYISTFNHIINGNHYGKQKQTIK